MKYGILGINGRIVPGSFVGLDDSGTLFLNITQDIWDSWAKPGGLNTIFLSLYGDMCSAASLTALMSSLNTNTLTREAKIGLELQNSMEIDGALIALSHNSQLTALQLSNSPLSSTALFVFFPKLETLILSSCRWKGEQAPNERLLPFKDHAALRKLSLQDCLLSDEGIKPLGTNTKIELLEISSNQLSSAAVASFSNNSAIQALKISHNAIGNKGVDFLVRNIAKLKKFDISSCAFSDLSVFAHNTTVTKLYCNNNPINETTIEPLVTCNSTITKLHLGDNKISSIGAKALALSATINGLKLYHNKIEDNGALALANNITLTSLDLGSNDITATNGPAFLTTTTLTKLNLNGNSLEEHLLASLEEILQQNTEQRDKRRNLFLLLLICLVEPRVKIKKGSADDMKKTIFSFFHLDKRKIKRDVVKIPSLDANV